MWFFDLHRRRRGSQDEAPSSPRRGRALVYRGPASLPGCPEAVADMLRMAGYRTKFVGPAGTLPISGPILATAELYAQPGGGELDEAWPHLEPHASDIRAFVEDGGLYLGICLGAYLAGRDPGLDLLPGDTDRWTRTRGAQVRDDRDAVVTLDWAGARRPVYFQDGACVYLERGADAEVVARYENGHVAALVADRGLGRVGVVGPHPEATADWFVDAGLGVPEPLAVDLALDLVHRLRAPARARRA